MSTVSIKKILLAGTAFAAVSIISAQAAQAQVVMTGPVTWGETAAATNGSPGPGAGAGDSVQLGANTLTITNDGTANDGTPTSPNPNDFTLGVITNLAGAGAINITQATNSKTATGPFAVTITGVGDLGTSSMAISSDNAANQSIAVTIGASGFGLGGNLQLTNVDASSTGQTVAMTINGPTAVLGTTGLVAGPGAGNAVSITNNGIATYAGTVGLSAGEVVGLNTAAGANATMTLNGSSTLADGVILNDEGAASSLAGQAILNFGTGTTTFHVPTVVLNAHNTAITGEAANEGTVNLLGSNTIIGAIGLPNAVFAVNAGVEGAASNITGAVSAETVTVNGGTNGTAGSLAIGSALPTSTLALQAGSLIVESAGTTTAQAESATVTGEANVSTLTAVAAGTFAGANATLILNGDANTLAGATGLIATTAGTTATLELNGIANTLSGTVTLVDSGAGSNGGEAVLDFGTNNITDTAAGGINITGGGADQGTVNLFGSNVITGAIGTTNAVFAVDAGVAGTISSISGAVNAGTVTIFGINDVAANGSVSFGSTLTVGTGGMVVASADTTTHAQAETATVNGVFTDAGVLNIIAGTTLHADASLNLNGATNTIAGVTTLTDGTAGLATLNVGAGSAVTFTGGIVGGASGQGKLAFAGASVVTGQIGTQTDMLRAVTIAGAGVDTFSSTVFATTMTTTTGAATVTLSGGFTGTTLSFGNQASTYVIADGQNINGNVEGGGGTNGILTLSGSTTVTGTVGATNPVSTINATGAAGKTVTFDSAVSATNLHIGDGSVLLEGGLTGNVVFNVPLVADTGAVTVSSGKNVTGDIGGTGGMAGTGVGTVTLAGTNTVGTIGAGGVLKALTLAGNVTAGNVLAADMTTLGANILAIGANTFTLGAGQTLASTINSATVFGKVTSTGATSVSATSKVNLTISPTAYLPTTTFILANGGIGAGVSTLNAGELTVNGINDGLAQTLTEGVITYSQVGGGTDELEIQATNNGTLGVASTPNNVAVAKVMDIITNTGNAALQAVQGRISVAPTAAAVNNILSTLAPTVDGGSQMASLEVNTEVQSITDTRMTALRADDGSTGVAAGASNNGASMWFQGYGESATQDERNLVAGYHASTWGSAIGADTEGVIDNGVLGLAFNYGKASVKSNNTNTTATDVGNYGLTFYSVAGLQDHMFIEGQMGYAYNKITSVRHDVGGGPGLDADGSTHSSQYDARMDFGRDFWMYGLGDAMVTPVMSASYTHLNTQGYTETGPGANLVVGGTSQNNLEIGLGEKMAWQIKEEDGSLFKPVLKASYSYAAVDDRIDTTASFAGAAVGHDPSFATEGPTPERNRINLGAGITYMSIANWDLSANYDFEYRPDYKANAGTLRATVHF